MARDRAFYERRAKMYARGAGIDPNLFARQIGAESNFDPTARSGAGAVGIAQIVPRYHPGVDPTNPDASLKYAAQLMGRLYKKYGNYQDALSVYNSGRPFKIGHNFSETRNYVAKILAGSNPQSNNNPTVKASTGDNTAFGAPAGRPQAVAAFLLTQVQNLTHGESFDLGGLVGAIQSDRAQSAEALHGMDPGGSDPADPRVKVEGAAGAYRGPGGARGMRAAIAEAKKLGLRVGENEAVGAVHQVHVKGSDHYRELAPGISAAADVSGDPSAESAYFRWVERNRSRLGLKDMFFTPMGYSYDQGKRTKYLQPGHKDHVHVSVF